MGNTEMLRWLQSLRTGPRPAPVAKPIRMLAEQRGWAKWTEDEGYVLTWTGGAALERLQRGEPL